MFGLDTIFILGVWAVIGGGAAAAANNNRNNNDRHWQEPIHATYHAPSYSVGSSSSYSSVHASSSYFEKRTIWDW